MSKLTTLSPADFQRILDGVPNSIRLDVVAFALDLIGIVDPYGVADAASGFLSLCRGDLLGAAISAGSLLPLGDVLKVARFARYANSMRDLVSIAFKTPKLAFALRTPLRQMRDLLNAITGLMGGSPGLLAEMAGYLGRIREQIDRYLGVMVDIDRFGIQKVAARKGQLSGAGQYVDKAVRGSEITVRGVVDVLDEALSGSNRAIREGANEMMARMALAQKWEILAGVHRSTTDATRHITVKLDTFAEAFHLRLSKEGHLFDITHTKAGVSTIR